MRHDNAFVIGADNRVGLPVSDAAFCGDNRRPLIDVDAVRKSARAPNSCPCACCIFCRYASEDTACPVFLVFPDMLIDALVTDKGDAILRQTPADLIRTPLLLRLAAGSSPFLTAAMIVIARVLACSQVSTELRPRLMRRDRRPDRYWTLYTLRPLGSMRSPNPGSSLSQMKYSAARISAASITRLVNFGMRRDPVATLDLLPGIGRAVRGSTMEARGRKPRREPAKCRVGIVWAGRTIRTCESSSEGRPIV